jgi:BON domain
MRIFTREVVRDVIMRQFLLDPQAFTVAVRDGVVTLSGRPESNQVGHLLAAAMRRVEGVVGLRDQMRYSAGRTAAWTVLPPLWPWRHEQTFCAYPLRHPRHRQ